MSLEQPTAVPRRAWYRRGPVVAAALVGGLVLVAVAALAATRVLVPAAPSGPLLLADHLPARTLIFVELDLEPDGGQAAALDALNERLAAFGAGDGAGRLLDPVLEGLSGGEYSYTRDIAPWSDGRVALAVLDWGSLGQVPNPLAPFPADPIAPGTVLLFGLEDREAAAGFTDRLRASDELAGLGWVQRDRGGWTTWMAAPDAPGQPGLGYAVGDELLVAAIRGADLDEIIALHDEGGEKLADVDSFRSEIARLPAERIGTLASRIGALPPALTGGALLGLGDSSTLGLLLRAFPLNQVGALVLAEDRIILERWQPSGVGLPQPAERRNDRLAAVFPADALLYAELPELGRQLSALGASIESDAVRLGGEDARLEVARVEGLLGRDLGAVGDWLGDVAVGGGGQDGVVGLVGETPDPEVAADFLDRVTQLVAGGGVAVDHGELDGVPLVRADVPFLFGSITLELTILDDRVVVGTEGFARWVRDTPVALGEDESYASALEEAGGAENAGVVYLSIERSLALMRAQPGLPVDWAELEPRAASVRDAIIVTFVEGDRVRSHLEIRLADPE